jgi:hypothetical protein
MLKFIAALAAEEPDLLISAGRNLNLKADLTVVTVEEAGT